jgi:ferric-dicitrate binding protein FerR (iron transport regulator)
MRRPAQLGILLWSLAGLYGPAPLPVAAAAATGERLLPLGPATVRQLHGSAWRTAAAPSARQLLANGATLQTGQRIETAADSHLELRFADSSLLRLGPGSAITLLSDQRQVALHCGRLLVAADRMLGSIAVLTQTLALLPEGTTYLVELTAATDGSPPQLELVVLEGAVTAGSVIADGAAKRPAAPQRRPELTVFPGERLTVRGSDLPAAPLPDSLTSRLKSEPLLTGFAEPLPSWRHIDDLADQQRRHLLAGRNQRLRRESFWKRPPRPPLKLPPLFSGPDSIIIRYELPK